MTPVLPKFLLALLTHSPLYPVGHSFMFGLLNKEKGQKEIYLDPTRPITSLRWCNKNHKPRLTECHFYRIGIIIGLNIIKWSSEALFNNVPILLQNYKKKEKKVLIPQYCILGETWIWGSVRDSKTL